LQAGKTANQLLPSCTSSLQHFFFFHSCVLQSMNNPSHRETRGPPVLRGLACVSCVSSTPTVLLLFSLNTKNSTVRVVLSPHPPLSHYHSLRPNDLRLPFYYCCSLPLCGWMSQTDKQKKKKMSFCSPPPLFLSSKPGAFCFFNTCTISFVAVFKQGAHTCV
jgi:hypothetical protein